MIWVELPSSAPILWFDVLSLVNWVAGLPSVSNVLSEYFSFFGLNPFLTYCCSGELQFASWTVRVLCFNLSEGVASELAARCLLLCCLSTFNLYEGVASELAARCLLLYCLSTFDLSSICLQSVWGRCSRVGCQMSPFVPDFICQILRRSLLVLD